MKFKVIVYNIPNIVTIINSFLGFSSILASIQAVIDFYLFAIGETPSNSSTHYVALAGVLIILATFFDFLDGVLARLLRVSSQMGREMDSFADLVSFGIAPGVLFFTVTMIAGNHIPGTDIIYQIDRIIPTSLLPHILFLKVLAFVFPTCVIIRLARFNITTSNKPSLYFQGIPSTFGGGTIALIFIFNFIDTPAIFLLSLFGVKWKFMEDVNGYFHPLFHDYFFLLIAYLFISFLMVSKIPYRKVSLIFKYFAKKKFIAFHILFVFLILFFTRYTMLVSMILYMILGIKRPVNKSINPSLEYRS